MRSNANAPSKTGLMARLMLACALGLALAVAAAPSASAGIVRPFLFEFGPNGTATTSFQSQEALAVDPASGDVFLTDRRFGEGGKGVVFRFTSTGVPHSFTEGPDAGKPRLTGFTMLNRKSQVAIAPPTALGGTAGNIYVASQGGVKEYSSEGALLGTIDGAGNPNPHPGGIVSGVAVDPAGNVYVGYTGFSIAQQGDFPEGSRLEKYVPSGSSVSNADFDSELTGFPDPIEMPCQPFVTATTVFVKRCGKPRSFRYPTSLFPGSDGSTDVTGMGTQLTDGNGTGDAFAIDPVSEDVYVGIEGSSGNTVLQLDRDGNELGTTELGPSVEGVNFASGVAVNPVTGQLYVSQLNFTEEKPRKIRVYGPGEEVGNPVAAIDPVSIFDFKSAHFSGTVNSGGTDPRQETSYRFKCNIVGSSPPCPGLQGLRDAPTDGLDHEVTDDTTDLQPETEYEVTLIAESSVGKDEDTITFTTPVKPVGDPPVVTIDPVTVNSATTAELTGTVDPGGPEEFQATKYRFEYTTAANYVSADEHQQLTVSATAGSYSLIFNGQAGAMAASGSGDLTSGSETVTDVKGKFSVGQVVSGQGIPAGTVITAVGLGTLTLSANATESAGNVFLGANWSTPPLPFDASSAEVEATLNALPPIIESGGSVEVTGGPGDATGSSPFEIDFVGALADMDLPQIRPQADLLTGGTGASIQTTTHGRALFDGAVKSPSPDGAIAAGEAPVAVSETVEGLAPDTTYYVRLVAENVGGGRVASEAPDPSFTTDSLPPEAPRAELTAATHVLHDSAQLNGRVDAGGAATTYYFEWGTADCASNPCASVPVGQNGDAGSGRVFEWVSEQLTGLAPSTTYHYRLLVANQVDGAVTSVGTFITDAAPKACTNQALRVGASANLPDCRAHEMVSPVDKNGGDISAFPLKARSATDGDAVTFASSTGFAGALGVSAKGAEYLSARGPGGWTTHPLTPPQAAAAAPTGAGSAYVGALSDDLNTGIFRGLAPIPGVTTANVEGVGNIYRATGMRSRFPSFELMSDSVGPIPPVAVEFVPHIQLADTSEDFSHVLFESTDKLTPGAGEEHNLYESVDGVVRFAGILPDDACGSPPCVAAQSAAGGGALTGSVGLGSHTQLANVISDDGSRIFFTAGDPLRPGSAALDFGSENEYAGSLYLREDGETTVQVDASERSTPDPKGPGRSIFQMATPDGEVAFFLSREQLVDEDDDGDGVSLYRYDVDAPEGERLTLMPTAGAVLKHVIGISQDGAYLYLLANKHDVYALRGGEMRLVADLESLGIESNLGDHGIYSPAGLNESRVTPDGRHLLFTARSNLTGFDPTTEGDGCLSERVCREVYLYGYDDDELVCASCLPAGAMPSGDAGFAEPVDAGLPVGEPIAYMSTPISEDGRYVFFHTPDPLVDEDTNGKLDAYVFDSEQGEARLLSSGQCNCKSVFLTASPDGEDAFFTTRQQLVRQDTDDLIDLYDARVEGGIASQNALSPAECQGDACLSPVVPPASTTPGSAGFAGPGNASERKPANRRCAQGKRRVTRAGKNRCVAKRKAKRKARAKHNRGAGR